MKQSVLLILFILNIQVSFAQNVDELLDKSPVETAEQAFTSGNTKLYQVPRCEDAIPGFRGNSPLSTPRQLYKSCKELLGDEQYQKLKKLEEWTEKYNQHIMSKYK